MRSICRPFPVLHQPASSAEAITLSAPQTISNICNQAFVLQSRTPSCSRRPFPQSIPVRSGLRASLTLLQMRQRLFLVFICIYSYKCSYSSIYPFPNSSIMQCKSYSSTSDFTLLKMICVLILKRSLCVHSCGD